MKITILEVYEQSGGLHVKVETDYGIETLGLGLDKKYLDPLTDEPKWKKEVRNLLEAKYGTLQNRQKKDVVEAIPILNKPITLDELAPVVVKQPPVKATPIK